MAEKYCKERRAMQVEQLGENVRKQAVKRLLEDYLRDIEMSVKAEDWPEVWQLLHLALSLQNHCRLG